MAGRTAKTKTRPIIVDTDILVWYFRGHAGAISFLRLIAREDRWLSSLSLMEVMQACRNHEELNSAEAFIAENFSRIIHPESAISEKAVQLISSYALSHGLRVIDALIAASALMTKAKLALANLKHYRFIPALTLMTFKP